MLSLGQKCGGTNEEFSQSSESLSSRLFVEHASHQVDDLKTLIRFEKYSDGNH